MGRSFVRQYDVQRDFNIKENERRAERERQEEKRKEEEHKAFLRNEEERKKKYAEEQKKLLDDRLKERISAFNDGNGGYCPRCNHYVQYVPCPNLRCNSSTVFGPLIDRIYEELHLKNEEKKTSKAKGKGKKTPLQKTETENEEEEGRGGSVSN